jgi:hypothetical protein
MPVDATSGPAPATGGRSDARPRVSSCRGGPRRGGAGVSWCRGELELAAGRFADAIGHLRQALDWWESLNLTLWRARTLRDLATALAAQGATAQAETTYQEAHRLFVHHGSREAGEPRRFPCRRDPRQPQCEGPEYQTVHTPLTVAPPPQSMHLPAADTLTGPA